MEENLGLLLTLLYLVNRPVHYTCATCIPALKWFKCAFLSNRQQAPVLPTPCPAGFSLTAELQVTKAGDVQTPAGG